MDIALVKINLPSSNKRIHEQITEALKILQSHNPTVTITNMEIYITYTQGKNP